MLKETRTVKAIIKKFEKDKGFKVEETYEANIFEESDWEEHKKEILELANQKKRIKQDDPRRIALQKANGDYRYKNRKAPPLVAQILTIPKAKRDIPKIATLFGRDPKELAAEVALWETES